MNIILVADNDWAIGRNGKLLARLPADMKRFKLITSGSAVVMGRKTFESLPKGALPDRDNYVISRSLRELPKARVFKSIKDFLEFSKTIKKDIFVIGGGEMYNQLIPYCKKAYVTRIYENFGGDVFVPDFDRLKEWKIEETSPVIETGCHKIRFVNYVHK